ncbi:tetratricopeptide repeat protein [Spirochaetota bacterium]
MKNIIFIILFSLLYTSLYTDEADRYFGEANEFYKQGKYVDALMLYRKVEQMTGKSASLYYNMGNCYFQLYRQGGRVSTNYVPNLGYTILYYERAHAIDPSDSDISYNLRFSRDFCIDKIEKDEVNILLRVIFFFYFYLSLQTAIILAVVFFIIAALLLMLFILLKVNFRQLLLNASIFFFAAYLLLFVSSIVKYKAQYTLNKGILLTERFDVRNAPEEDYSIAFRMHEGTIFEIRDERDEWYFVVLPNGFNGWVKKEFVGIK